MIWEKQLSKNYLKKDDTLMFEICNVTEKYNIFTSLLMIIYLILFQGIFAPKMKNYIIGIGKLNIYILYLGKYSNISDDIKPKEVQIISTNLIKNITINSRFIGLFYKISIQTKEEILIFYVGRGYLNKSQLEYIRNMLKS